MDVPGQVGYPVLGDETVEFVRTPLDYVNRKVASHGGVFAGRLLNKPTVFLSSNAAVHELLNSVCSTDTAASQEWDFSVRSLPPSAYVRVQCMHLSLLPGQWDHFSLGYNEYHLPRLFDDGLIFLEGDAWREVREALDAVFDHGSVSESMASTAQ